MTWANETSVQKCVQQSKEGEVYVRNKNISTLYLQYENRIMKINYKIGILYWLSFSTPQMFVYIFTPPIYHHLNPNTILHTKSLKPIKQSFEVVKTAQSWNVYTHPRTLLNPHRRGDEVNTMLLKMSSCRRLLWSCWVSRYRLHASVPAFVRSCSVSLRSASLVIKGELRSEENTKSLFQHCWN